MFSTIVEKKIQDWSAHQTMQIKCIDVDLKHVIYVHTELFKAWLNSILFDI